MKFISNNFMKNYRIYFMAAMGGARKPVNTLWRAGLSRVGLRSSPIKEERGVSDTL
jgi:hypothetical protein